MTIRRWRILLWCSTLLLGALVLWQARGAMLPFAIGAVLAYAISPLVDRLVAVAPARTRRAEVWRRGVTLIAIYALFFGALITGMLVLVPVAFEQVNRFIDVLPGIMDDVRERAAWWIDEYHRATPEAAQPRIEAALESTGDAIGRGLGVAARASLGAVTQTVALVFGFAIVPFWMFYAIRDSHFITASVLRAVPPVARDDVRMIGRMADTLLGRYIRGQLFLGLIVGVAVGVAMTVLGVQLSLGLGVWAGITELVPIIGPWLGAVPGLLIVLATEPRLLPWVALVYIVVQQIENNLLVPRIQGNALDLHPAAVILLLVVGGAVWGFIGLVIVVPLAAMLRELFWYADRRLRGQTPEQSFNASHAGGRHGTELPLESVIDPTAPLPDDEPEEAPADAGDLEPVTR